jgi:hypothetical protein
MPTRETMGINPGSVRNRIPEIEAMKRRFLEGDSKRAFSVESSSATIIKIPLRLFTSGRDHGVSFVCPSCKVRREVACDPTKSERGLVVWCIYCKQSWDVQGKERSSETDLLNRRTFPLAG